MRAGLRIVGVGVLSAAVFLAGAVHLPGQHRGEADGRHDSGILFTRVATGSMAETIVSLQRRLREAPSDWRAAAALGLAYVQEARITADPTSYPAAEQALRHSLSLRPENVDGLVGMGSLALGRHDFQEALAWGRRAVSANPYGVAGYGVVGDALIELGRYRQAFREYQRMADLRPGLSAYARASYARELQGDLLGAIRLMRMAEQAAGSLEDAAWTAFELGELYWATGRLGQAEASYRRALRWTPSFVAPRAGLARVSWAHGRLEEAITQYRRVVTMFPAPEHVAALGDLYASTGRTQLARNQYALVRAQQRLFESDGVNVDLELALFDADHGRPLAALRAARTAWTKRQSVQAADTLAWALFKSGEHREAAEYAKRALRLGTHNAFLSFHAGMIELRLGNDDRARRLLADALQTNPHFSIIHSGTARRALARLEAAG
jgi:tetratricopeptide (TPR) repeat protein